MEIQQETLITAWLGEKALSKIYVIIIIIINYLYYCKAEKPQICIRTFCIRCCTNTELKSPWHKDNPQGGDKFDFTLCVSLILHSVISILHQFNSTEFNGVILQPLKGDGDMFPPSFSYSVAFSLRRGGEPICSATCPHIQSFVCGNTNTGGHHQIDQHWFQWSLAWVKSE